MTSFILQLDLIYFNIAHLPMPPSHQAAQCRRVSLPVTSTSCAPSTAAAPPAAVTPNHKPVNLQTCQPPRANHDKLFPPATKPHPGRSRPISIFNLIFCRPGTGTSSIRWEHGFTLANAQTRSLPDGFTTP
jgi:hypothetical protein